jgi:hypothetical protein
VRGLLAATSLRQSVNEATDGRLCCDSLSPDERVLQSNSFQAILHPSVNAANGTFVTTKPSDVSRSCWYIKARTIIVKNGH